jgi:glycerophosphoryl diester phosphodiesterase
MISKGQRYIGCRKLSPGMHGPYGYRGTYITDCYHIVCLLKVAQTKAESEIQNASSEIRELRNQISSFKDTKSQRKKQIEYCETAKQRAKREYESSKSWRRLVEWVGHKYTSWSKNREIQSLEREIIHIENREIPVRENRINELLGRINHSRTRQTRLNEESREFLNLTERMKRT